jgi:A/G-specific adenine glycosylase
MLQQTQVATVIPYYHEWLRRFPDFAAVARASKNEILHAWQDLGYYARARYLQAAAKTVQNRYDGRFPRDRAAIRTLPGVGRYTANAIASFAFDQPVPIVEANTARVLARLFDLRSPIDQAVGREALWKLATALVPKRAARIYNSALVDLGALVCLPRRPKCRICPVNKFCRSKNPGTIPIRRARPRIVRLSENHAFVVKQKKILLQRAEHRWRGMLILPPTQRRSANQRPVYRSIFPFTNHRIAFNVFARRPRKIAKRSQRWIRLASLASVPIPSPHRRALRHLLSEAPAARSRQQRSLES